MNTHHKSSRATASKTASPFAPVPPELCRRTPNGGALAEAPFLLTGLLLVVVMLRPLSAFAAPSPIRLGAGPTQPTLSGAGGSFAPSFSGDGRSIVFLSQARNLVTNDDRAPFLDVFVRNRQTGLTQLVSVNRSGTGGGNADAAFASVSADGQRIVFASGASNLAGNDTNKLSDIFLRDLAANTTTLVSVDVTGSIPGNGLSTAPTISADGRWVAFESDANDLVTNDLNGFPTSLKLNRDVFVRDLWSNTTALVSVSADGLNSGVAWDWWGRVPAASDSPAMTPDGRFVAFRSGATNLIPGGIQVFIIGQGYVLSSTWSGIFVRDMQSGQTVWASTNVTAWMGADNRCENPVLSADGQVVAFKAFAGAATNRWVFRQDLRSGQTTCLGTNARMSTFPQISADGRFVGFEDSTNILVWDAQTGSNFVANVNTDGTPITPGPAHTPVLTPDGRYLTFLAQNTAPFPVSPSVVRNIYQVFQRDLQTGTTRLISALPNGSSSAEGCDAGVPAISSDGQWVAFESGDDHLVAGDANRASDVFLRDVVGGTTSLISASHQERPALTGAGMCRAWPNCLSEDGRLLVCSSLDNNLTASDTNGLQDVFLRDLAAGTKALLTGGPNCWNDPSISANGHY